MGETGETGCRARRGHGDAVKKSEDRRQRTEDREQRTDDRGRMTDGSLFRATEPQRFRSRRSDGKKFKVPSSRFKVRMSYKLTFCG
jgi:hypothetical protein